MGTKNGRLTVLSLDHTYSYVQDNGTKQTIKYFLCQCDCGNTTTVRQASLKSTKSCGCQRVEENKSRTLDITGQTFGRLTAIEKDLDGKWLCSCECGNFVAVKVAALNNGNTKSCGCLQKEHASNSMSGMLKSYRKSLNKDENIPLSSDYKIQRAEFYKLSTQVKVRDEFSCVWCNATDVKLEAHHLVPWSVDSEKRFTTSNLVTLCKSCHLKIHKGNFIGPVDEIMTILLEGYTSLVEDYDGMAVRIELTPN